MKDELKYFGEKLIQDSKRLAIKLEEHLNDNYSQSLRNAGMPLNELREIRAEIIHCLGEALNGDETDISQRLDNWGIKAAEFALRYEVPLSGSIRAVSYYRSVLWDVFTEELELRDFAAKTMLDIAKIIDPMIDQVCNVIGEVYERHNHHLMSAAYTALDELSVPVVPISKGIAVIPIVGEIDARRSRLIMEVSLNAGTELQLNHIILDVSGVPIVDTMAADQLMKIISALKLTGVESILTGLRPEIAQTIVGLGIGFTDIQTQANMRKALETLGFKQVK
ncbi:STAS domain-containing protein [Neobacillus terrae]|uniref:STAS domain-containing protein n=1 Tax=Neobacillus terrae TaxID=3034837 RepID=UPI00140CA267|nr:STAS domain-containing protein [Neobacillus terrae]NHM32656.1 STAS domain-containing protein [Neobacillus terrae]